MSVDYLCIGHCCHDRVGESYMLGGTASYASLVAKRMGRTPAVLTSVGDDFLYRDRFRDLDIELYEVAADHTTVFENIYGPEGRTQYMHARAGVISKADVPISLINVPIVHICSIAREIDWDILNAFDRPLIGATIQGMIRDWDSSGLISSKEMDWSELSGVNIVIMSDDDIAGIKDPIPEIRKYVDQIVLTKNREGAYVYTTDNQYFFPAFPVKEIDATGAGDVFTTAYMIRYAQTKDIEQSCIMAHCAASFVVEGNGINKLPSLSELQERITAYQSIHNI